ncbi:MAG: WYL domain-containing protein [Bacteroidetes bacterium]|nr:WYL domain-containing protein [Bacteroidota bacterium]
MAKQDYIFRYLTIIRKLRRSQYATFAEINDFLEQETALQDRNHKMSLRTFQRDLKEISENFKVTIAYDFSKRVYYIENDEQSDMNNRMIESLDTLNSLRVAGDIGRFMYFEKRAAQGTHHFYGLLHAIKNRIVLNLKHQKFDEEEPSVREVAPYALKESRGRWYLVARDMADRRIKTFGLDRVLDFQTTSRRFDYPPDFDVNRHFRYCFGVINPDNARPEEIMLSFDPDQGKYIKSYPLHESQEIITDNAAELRIRLHLYCTYDLVQEILSYGDRVTVMLPEFLKKDITTIAVKMLEPGTRNLEPVT